MVVEQVLLVEGIGLHRLVMLKTLENDLGETVVVGHVGHLSIKELHHERAGLQGVVDDGPPPDAVFDHEVLGQRRGDQVHVSSVRFLAHAGFAVAEDRQAEVLAWWQAGLDLHRVRSGDGERILLCIECHCLGFHVGERSDCPQRGCKENLKNSMLSIGLPIPLISRNAPGHVIKLCIGSNGRRVGHDRLALPRLVISPTVASVFSVLSRRRQRVCMPEKPRAITPRSGAGGGKSFPCLCLA